MLTGLIPAGFPRSPTYSDPGGVGEAMQRDEPNTMQRKGVTSFSVMCVDDNVLLVEALERRLALEDDFAELYHVADFSNVLGEVLRFQPTVVLLDIDLPGGVDAVAVLNGLVRDAPASRVIVFTGYPSGELVSRTMGLGAWGFVSKGVRSERLINAIRRVVTGEAVIALED
ncbi:MAG: response regulator [Gemmatimonadaceae bacterium]